MLQIHSLTLSYNEDPCCAFPHPSTLSEYKPCWHVPLIKCFLRFSFCLQREISEWKANNTSSYLKLIITLCALRTICTLKCFNVEGGGGHKCTKLAAFETILSNKHRRLEGKAAVCAIQSLVHVFGKEAWFPLHLEYRLNQRHPLTKGCQK